MKENEIPNSNLFGKLKFRRQFLLGPEKYCPNKHWINIRLKQKLILSIHEDLKYYNASKATLSVTLIGIAIDCREPDKTPSEIVNTLLEQSDSVNSLITASKPLAGRWIIIYQNKGAMHLINDPCSLRQIYYYYDNGYFCFASQPALISQIHELTLSTDSFILNHRKSADYKKRETPWFGNKTIFNNCYHLMPNHYLSCYDNQLKQIRFFPLNVLNTCDDNVTLAKIAADYLKNIINGLSKNHTLKIGLTSGFDTRILLAASREVSKQLKYYVNDLGKFKKHHDDIWVSKNLADKFNLSFTIENTPQKVPAWFYKQLARNVNMARVNPPIPKVRAIYHQLMKDDHETIFINGNVIEIVRITEQRLKHEPNYELQSQSQIMNALIQFAGISTDYVRSEIKQWFQLINSSKIKGATLFDLFYWEQRMGNWGSLHPAEINLANDQISPFNCRLLIETCLKVPREDRMTPDYEFFKRVIKVLWPELLSEPINPGPRGFGLVKKKLRENMPASVVRTIRKLVN